MAQSERRANRERPADYPQPPLASPQAGSFCAGQMPPGSLETTIPAPKSRDPISWAGLLIRDQ